MRLQPLREEFSFRGTQATRSSTVMSALAGVLCISQFPERPQEALAATEPGIAADNFLYPSHLALSSGLNPIVLCTFGLSQPMCYHASPFCVASSTAAQGEDA
jgi:hypothetical protein